MKDDALYLEADEDITSAIDKLHKSGATSVQIVVPKRSTMLQSIINLKLLKKAAEQDGKALVLVTNDRVASDLAGRVGLAVAPSLGAKAVIAAPALPKELQSAEEIIEASDPEPPPRPPESPVKPTPKKPLLIKRRDVSDAPQSPNVAAIDAEADDSSGSAASSESSAKVAPKVPNFGKLKKRVAWLAVAAILIAGYMFGMYYFSNAKVTLFTNGNRVAVTATFTADPNVSSSSPGSGTLAAKVITSSKDLAGPFTPTGKQDAGSKATGSMVLTNSSGVDQPLVSGTRFQAPDGNIFLSQQAVTVPAASLDPAGDKINGSATVPVSASQNGDTYNEASAAYTIPALSNPKISAQGSQMSGGITKTVNVVTQPDVDTEQASLISQNASAAASALAAQVPSGYTAITSSAYNVVSNVQPSPVVGAIGNTGQLQIHVVYSELTVQKPDFDAFLQASELKQVGSGNQIYDDGMPSAQVSAGSKTSSGAQSFQLATTAYSGPTLDVTAIAAKIKGERYGDAMTYAQSLPNVSQATINIWPGWASSLPARAAKIRIVISVSKQ
jgi:hypothetical protein